MMIMEVLTAFTELLIYLVRIAIQQIFAVLMNLKPQVSPQHPTFTWLAGLIAGQSVVCEVMRRILAARAIHNLFTTTELNLTITNTHLVLIDPASGIPRLQHSLKDIAYWAAHSENHK